MIEGATTSRVPGMTPYFSAQTMLSILAPEGWTGERIGTAGFRLFAPPEPRFGYRPSIGFERTPTEARDVEWLDRQASNSDREIRADYEDFELEREDRLYLSSGAPMYTRWFGWKAPLPGLRFAQVQALMLDPGRYFYVVNAATLADIAAETMPVFGAMLASIRIIPEPAAQE